MAERPPGRPRRWRMPGLVVLLACALAQATPAWSAQAASGWDALDAAQREALAPLRTQWDALAPAEQDRLLRAAARWQVAPAARRARIEARIERWATLAPAQRERIAARIERFRALPPPRQQALRDAYRRFHALPPDERAALRRRFAAGTGAAADEANADGGPESMPGSRMPDDLRAFRLALDAGDRQALHAWWRALPPDRRAAERARVLAMEPAARSAWIARLPR